MAVGSELSQLGGYPFEVRYSDGSLVRARAAADVAASAYVFLSHLFGGVEPDIAVIVAGEADWSGNGPYGLPFFRDDAAEIRPGIVLMPAGGGDFWKEIGQDIRDASPRGYAKLLATYPDGTGGLDLQPFFDLITIHELGHAFEVLGDLRLPTFWLSEIFVNLAMHAFVATQRPASLPTLEVLPTVGAGSRKLAARMRAEGYSTLEELQAHYTGGDDSMDPLNYVWYQHRWLRLARPHDPACFAGRPRPNETLPDADVAKRDGPGSADHAAAAPRVWLSPALPGSRCSVGGRRGRQGPHRREPTAMVRGVVAPVASPFPGFGPSS